MNISHALEFTGVSLKARQHAASGLKPRSRGARTAASRSSIRVRTYNAGNVESTGSSHQESEARRLTGDGARRFRIVERPR